MDLRTAIGSIAPTLATMLGGPLAGTAVSALASVFGLGPGATQQDVIAEIQKGQLTPDIIASMRAADQAHAERLKQMDIDLVKINADAETAFAQIDAGDRDSARKREEAVGGWTTPILAWVVVGGSIATGLAVLAGLVDMKEPTLATTIGTVIGYIFSEAKGVLAYYFGSTSGSAHKSELLAKATPAAEPNVTGKP